MRSPKPESFEGVGPGSRNKRGERFDEILHDVKRRGEYSTRKRLLALYEVAIDPKHPLMVAANRELNDREFGKVRQNIGVEHTHELSVENVLREIAAERRKRIEAGVVGTEIVGANVNEG